MGVNDRTLDSFDLSHCGMCVGRCTGRKHTSPALCKGHSNGKQFPGDMDNLILKPVSFQHISRPV